ncbi:MAG: hypothetical protein ACRELX_08810 [Longimicrobiales bacterium]
MATSTEPLTVLARASPLVLTRTSPLTVWASTSPETRSRRLTR